MAEPKIITELQVENYGCIKKQTFALSPLHAFVGPNDSGKSTILHALETLLVVGAARNGEGLRMLTGVDKRWPATSDARLGLRLDGHRVQYAVVRSRSGMTEKIIGPGARSVFEVPLAGGNQPTMWRSSASTSRLLPSRCSRAGAAITSR
jgi:hypothetical protein